jgi:hypothetical protein
MNISKDRASSHLRGGQIKHIQLILFGRRQFGVPITRYHHSVHTLVSLRDNIFHAQDEKIPNKKHENPPIAPGRTSSTEEQVHRTL